MSSFTTPLSYVDTGKRKPNTGLPIYKITEEFSYAVGSLEAPILVITVPVGFETDLATIPWPVNIFFRPDGPWAKAAVIHDFLYYVNHNSLSWADVSRVVRDSIFYEAMLVLKVNKAVALLFFTMVRIFGQSFVAK